MEKESSTDTGSSQAKTDLRSQLLPDRKTVMEKNSQLGSFVSIVPGISKQIELAVRIWRTAMVGGEGLPIRLLQKVENRKKYIRNYSNKKWISS